LSSRHVLSRLNFSSRPWLLGFALEPFFLVLCGTLAFVVDDARNGGR
jgi:hypothetical protein